MQRWATFDCYGTLIDWNAGILGVLEQLFGVERAPELLARYHELEPELEQDGSLPYKAVLTEALIAWRRKKGCPFPRASRMPLSTRCLSGSRFPKYRRRWRSSVTAAGTSSSSPTPTATSSRSR